jgi:hypothetical protein
VKEPPADILRRLRPIPTDRRRGPAHDVDGVDPSGARLSLEIMGATAPVLLLFLSAACIGCLDLWEGLAEFRAGLPRPCRLAVVTRSPEEEDASDVVSLARFAAGVPGDPVPVVMSTAAYGDYRVDGPPFYAVVGPVRVLGEGVAWGVDATLGAVSAALLSAE